MIFARIIEDTEIYAELLIANVIKRNKTDIPVLPACPVACYPVAPFAFIIGSKNRFRMICIALQDAVLSTETREYIGAFHESHHFGIIEQ